METAPRRFVKPLAPPVVADRSEMEGLSRIKDFEVREHAVYSGRYRVFLTFRCGTVVSTVVAGVVVPVGWQRRGGVWRKPIAHVLCISACLSLMLS